MNENEKRRCWLLNKKKEKWGAKRNKKEIEEKEKKKMKKSDSTEGWWISVTEKGRFGNDDWLDYIKKLEGQTLGDNIYMSTITLPGYNFFFTRRLID